MKDTVTFCGTILIGVILTIFSMVTIGFLFDIQGSTLYIGTTQAMKKIKVITTLQQDMYREEIYNIKYSMETNTEIIRNDIADLQLQINEINKCFMPPDNEFSNNISY